MLKALSLLTCLQQLRLPALLAIGDEGVVSAAVAAELQGLNGRLQVEQIEAAGHALHLDQPARFAAVVKGFLRSVGAAEPGA